MAARTERCMETPSGVVVTWFPNIELAGITIPRVDGESITLSLSELREITEWVANQFRMDDGRQDSDGNDG